MTNWDRVLKLLYVHCPQVADMSLETALEWLYYDCNFSTQDIANLIGNEVSSVAIRDKMRRLGIKVKKRGGPNNTKITSIPIEEYREMTYDQLAFKYGVSVSTIHHHVKEYIKKEGKKTKAL
jgi:transposase